MNAINLTESKGCLLGIGGLYPGLTLSCCVKMAKQGFPIAILHRVDSSRSESEVEETRVEIEKYFSKKKWPLKIFRITNDSCEIEIHRVCKNIVDCFGCISGMIFGQGTNAYPFRKLDEFVLSDWRSAFERDFFSFQAYIGVLVAIYKKQQYGKIIVFSYSEEFWNNNMVCRGGHVHLKNNWTFIISKELIIKYVSSIYMNLMSYNISINIVSLGAVSKPCLSDLLNSKKLCDRNIASDLDVSNVVSFLLLDNTSHISGSNICVMSKPKFHDELT